MSELPPEDAVPVAVGDVVSDAEAIVEGLTEPVDWAFEPTDSGLSKQFNECYMGRLWKMEPYRQQTELELR